ncbi:major capsid protein [Tortoise microvirus 34]|nr:major capsid protein [Tortoise microvirus 34]
MKSNSGGKGFYRVNSFDLTHDRKQTMKMGVLTPCLCEEVVPGDTFRVQTDLALRLAPLVAPMMHRVDVYCHYFFVPTRLLWKNWSDFLTGGRNGDLNPIYPVKDLAIAPGSLADYLGFPVTDLLPVLRISALPFRAYQMIYNEWYRDQNLIAEAVVSTEDGVDSTTSVSLQRRAWRKGYFESALPWSQRGSAVSLPAMSEGAKVVTKPNGHNWSLPISNNDMSIVNGSAKFYRANGGATTVTTNVHPNGVNNTQDFDTGLRVATDGVIPIRDIRLAFQVQKYLEKNARAGVRYIEWLQAHFGVKSSDARLQRPEYLGGGKSPLVVGEVLQTSSTDSTSPQANPAGTAVSAQRTLSFTRSFEEYGYILGIVSVMPKPAYQQGLPRKFTRFGRYDQYLPVLAHVGDQPILSKELYADGSAGDDTVFGYAPRYEELRKSYDTVHGQFRTTLDFWHLGRKFDSRPTLGKDFVECFPSKRVFAVTDPAKDEIWMHMLHNIKALRPVPKYGDPGLLDHN